MSAAVYVNDKNFLHGADELSFFAHKINLLPISRVCKNVNIVETTGNSKHRGHRL